MKKLFLGLFLLGLTIQAYSQTIELDETLVSVNHKYQNAIESDNVPLTVKKFETEVLNYSSEDVAEIYNEYGTYEVIFSSKDGEILAVYDVNGKIIKTTEKYNDVKLPLAVLQAISKRYPNCGIIGDDYHINYHCKKDILTQEYHIKIKNEDDIITIKTNKNGMFL